MSAVFPPLLILDRYDLGWSGDMSDQGPHRPDRIDDATGMPRLCPIRDFIPADLPLFEHRFDFDAHCTMYFIPGESCAPRIRKSAVRDGKIAPRLGWIIIDVDTPDHGDLADAPLEWIEQVIEAEITIPELAYAIRWESKGGYKYAWPLAEDRQYPVEIGEDYLRQFIDYLVEGGLPVDEACKDWTRLMRMPNARREGDPRSGTYKVEGWESLRELDWEPPRRPEKGGHRAAGRARRSGEIAGTDPLLQRCREALTFIPADLPYQDWLAIGIALRVTFQERGLDVWRAWSKGGDGYPGDKEIEEKWESFPDQAIPDGLTVRSIFHMAREHGWQDRLSIEEAQEILEGAIGIEDYFDADVLTAAATLRLARGAEWAVAVEAIKGSRAVPRFSDWEAAVVTRQREMIAARKEAEAQVKEAEIEALKARNKAPISNFIRDYDLNGDEIRYRKDLPTILEEVRARTGGWPRLMDTVLFAPQDMGPVFLEKSGELFSWLELETGTVEWTGRDVLVDSGGAVQAVNKEQMFFGLRQSMEDDHRYKTVETIPHVPRVDGAYYFDRPLPKATGATLKRFVDLFNPASPEDRCLIKAAILTGMWGGAPGKRPAFVITSDYGRGSGKSSTATAIAQVYGGAIGIRADDGWNNLQARLLDPSTVTKRYVLVDNLKNSLSSAEFEAMITEPVINGKRMYVGDGERVNLLTWFFTANTPSLSNDLASRSVVIKVGEADHSIDFEAEVEEILTVHKEELLADIVAELQAPPKGHVINHYDRWQAWQRAILSRFENADDLARLIIERRGDVDDDAATAEMWADAIQELLREHGHGPLTCKVVIPSMQIVDLARKVEQDRTITSRQAWDLLRDVIGVGVMKSARRVKHPYRGLLWIGPDSEPLVSYEKFGDPENPIDWKNKNVGGVKNKKSKREDLPF